jgi:hypothetical protein
LRGLLPARWNGNGKVAAGSSKLEAQSPPGKQAPLD